MWSMPVKMCIIPIFTKSRKLALCSRPSVALASSVR